MGPTYRELMNMRTPWSKLFPDYKERMFHISRWTRAWMHIQDGLTLVE